LLFCGIKSLLNVLLPYELFYFLTDQYLRYMTFAVRASFVKLCARFDFALNFFFIN